MSRWSQFGCRVVIWFRTACKSFQYILLYLQQLKSRSNRKTIHAGLLFAVGISFFYLFPTAPALYLILLIAVGVLILAWWICWLRSLFWILLGICWADLQIYFILSEAFPEALARKQLIIEGQIASIPIKNKSITRFLFQVERTLQNDQPIEFKGLIQLKFYNAPNNLWAGEHWRFPVRLKPCHSTFNPGGFDYERYFFYQGIQAIGSVRRDPGLIKLDVGAGNYWLTRWRQKIAIHLANIVKNPRNFGLIQVIVIGDYSGLTIQDKEILKFTGTVHLVAISGLNFGLIAGFFSWVTRQLWSFSARLTFKLAAPRAGAIAGIITAWFYSLLVGFSFATQRALIMVTVIFGAVILRRTLTPAHGFTLAFIIILIWDPRSVISNGFWLSVAGVAVLLLRFGYRIPRRAHWTDWIRMQWAITIGLTAFLLFLFEYISFTAPIVNLVAVPIFSIILLPLTLISSLISLFPDGTWPLLKTGELLSYCMDILAWSTQFPTAKNIFPQFPLWFAQIPLWSWGSVGIGTGLLLLPAGIPGRWLGIILLLPIIFYQAPVPNWGELWFSLLDVGQGLSAVAQTQAGTLVFDTGPSFYNELDAGQAIVAPFLLNQGVRSIRILIISHADLDHSGGLQGLLKFIPVEKIVSGEPTRLKISAVAPCQAGENWSWSGVKFRFLAPQDFLNTQGNRASCVLQIITGNRALLITGDADAYIEKKLVHTWGTALHSDILIAGHHGSASSSSEIFLQTVKPKWILFAAGYMNRFNFPKPVVLKRAAQMGSIPLITADTGAIQIKINAAGEITDPLGWRDQSGHIWNHKFK